MSGTIDISELLAWLNENERTRRSRAINYRLGWSEAIMAVIAHIAPEPLPVCKLCGAEPSLFRGHIEEGLSCNTQNCEMYLSWFSEDTWRKLMG
jgi:hypothetical protein